MPKTIRELADELNVSKQTIQYHYQKLSAKDRQKDSRGANLISPTAERVIRGKVAKTSLAKKQQIDSKENNELVATLRREVEDLKFQRDKQLATKDQQISSKDQQIDHLTKLIDQQQQLQLETVAEKRQLKKHVRKLSGLLEPSSPTQKPKAINKQLKREVVESNKGQERIHKNKTNKSWWHFWRYFSKN